MKARERLVKIVKRLFGVSDEAAEAEKKADRVIAKRETKKKTPRPILAGTATALLVLACLPSCAAIGKWVPRAQFSIGAFGVTLAVDTRTLTDAVGEVAVSVSDLVLPQPPLANAGLPAPVSTTEVSK